MLLAGQVQRGNGTDGAPQGDGINVHAPWEATGGVRKPVRAGQHPPAPTTRGIAL